jgi:hypothetical protein
MAKITHIITDARLHYAAGLVATSEDISVNEKKELLERFGFENFEAIYVLQNLASIVEKINNPVIRQCKPKAVTDANAESDTPTKPDSKPKK